MSIDAFWDHVLMAAESESAGEELKSIFVISPIGKLDDGGVDFTKLFLEQIVKPAAKLAGGFKTPVRADEVKAPGSITAKVVADIVNADVCVADLTGRNPNVMYEVAIAHAAGRPVILLQQEEGGPPFDFTSERTIRYSIRVDEANEARDDLAEHLKNAHHDEADPQLRRTMNPVRTIFEDLRTRAEAAPSERAILDRLDVLSARIRELDRRPPVASTPMEEVRVDAASELTLSELRTTRSRLQAIKNEVLKCDGPPPPDNLKLAIESTLALVVTKGHQRSVEALARAWDSWVVRKASSEEESMARRRLVWSIDQLNTEIGARLEMRG